MLDFNSFSLFEPLPNDVKTDGVKVVEELVLKLKGISASDDLN